MRAPAPILGVAAALALCVWGGVLTYGAIDSLTDGAREGKTRTPIPGVTDVELEKGKYVLFYEIDTGSVPDVEDSSLPAFDLRIRRSGDGASLELDDYGSDFTVEGGGRTARAALTVKVPSDGRYRIAASGRPEAGDPAVVLGRPVTRRVLRLVLGLTALVAGLALGTLVIAVTAVLALRKRRAAG